MSHFAVFFWNLSFMSFIKKVRQTMEGEKNNFFRINDCVSISGCITRNRNGQKVQYLNELVLSFSHRHSCINKPCWQVNEIAILWSRQYSYLRDTDNLLDVFLLFLLVILSEQHEIQEKKNELQEYRFSNILGKWHQFFGCTLSPLCHFLLLLCQPLPSLLSDLLFAS